MKRILAIATVATVTVLTAVGAGAQTPALPAPTNLEVVATTEDSITVAWGPSMVSDFQAYDAARKNRLLVTWAPSTDTRGPVSYTVYKNGVLAGTVLVPEYLVTGITTKIKSFRICVVPTSVAGSGPQNCSTFTRI